MDRPGGRRRHPAQAGGCGIRRVTDHGQALPRALAKANDRAWHALAVALAGDGLLDRIKTFFASGDDKGVREQIRRFLDSKPFPMEGTSADFRRACLDELERARKAGDLHPWADPADVAEIARQARDFRRYSELQGLMDDARLAVHAVADALAPDYPKLALLLRQPVPKGPPLLASAFAYFFRREVATNAELAHGLFFDGLQRLFAGQEEAFAEVGHARDSLGAHLGLIDGVVVATHEAVLDLQTGLLRLGELHLASDGEIRELFQKVIALLAPRGMQTGEVRAQHSLSIHSEGERRAVKQLLDRFRQLPPDQQSQVPALRNGLGKLQVGAGEGEPNLPWTVVRPMSPQRCAACS